MRLDRCDESKKNRTAIVQFAIKISAEQPRATPHSRVQIVVIIKGSIVSGPTLPL